MLVRDTHDPTDIALIEDPISGTLLLVSFDKGKLGQTRGKDRRAMTTGAFAFPIEVLIVNQFRACRSVSTGSLRVPKRDHHIHHYPKNTTRLVLSQ
jgi:hypothetical protein